MNKKITNRWSYRALRPGGGQLLANLLVRYNEGAQ